MTTETIETKTVTIEWMEWTGGSPNRHKRTEDIDFPASASLRFDTGQHTLVVLSDGGNPLAAFVGLSRFFVGDAVEVRTEVSQ